MLVSYTQKGRRMSGEDFRAAERRAMSIAASRHISNYFVDLKTPPDLDIHCPRYIDMCLDMDICGAVDMAYESMKNEGRLQGACGDGTMGEDTRFVLGLLKGIRRKCVPQEFSAGILLMHLEIVEGLKF